MAPQDSFIDEEEETCPLCIEEFDLSDRSFRPCPCGYQVCQFCFNNIRNNMNGLCPACRRPYDEKDIEWKVVTPEEVAEFSANIRKNQKKRANDQRQKEVQKREAERENRKNLVGVRVVQKNLVYVTGLTPTVREDELLKTLRKPEFFGQYGNIQKISISNRKSSDGQNQSLGIYVTFEKQDDAQRCIQAVNGSPNGDRVLRAQLGTTKYCSAWLRHEQCGNRQCMFLHELGDEEDSYTRQDLSSMNSINSQRPLPNGGTSRSVSRQQNPSSSAAGHSQPPAPAPAPVTTTTSQPMARSSSKEGSDNGTDGSALPAAANWARNPPQSRRGSHATSGVAHSPAISSALPTTNEAPSEAIDDSPAQSTQLSQPLRQASLPESVLKNLMKAIEAYRFTCYGADPSEVDTSPPLFDLRGGEKRRAMREEEEARLAVDQEEQVDVAEPSEGEPEAGGSLALGGEPEDRETGRESSFGQRGSGSQPPIQRSGADGVFGPAIGSSFGQGGSAAGSRSMTPQQQAFMRTQSGFTEHLPPGLPTAGQQAGGSHQQQGGHNRSGSRFNFANENAGSSIKVSANRHAMAEQAAMMPSGYHPQQQQANRGQFYGSSMPGPPPGLKSTGTPPSMFNQNQVFGGAGGSFGGGSKDSAELLQSLINRRGGGGANNQAHDAGKRELMLSFSQYPPSTSTSSTPAPASGLLASLYGNQPAGYQEYGPKQKKKGKKHRHANTSSSGGGGVVDMADPSILQARMHQSQQSNAGVGQGPFNGGGGQSQDDELPSLAEASSSVDALVSDDPPGNGIFRPILPSAAQQGPPPPPGLGLGSTTPRTKPAPIAMPAVPSRVQTPVSEAAQVSSATPDDIPSKKILGSELKKNIKAAAIESGLARDIVSNSPAAKSKNKVLQDEDFPALDSSRSVASKTASPSVSNVPTPNFSPATIKKVGPASPSPVVSPASSAAQPTKPSSSKGAAHKPVPGTLNIGAATAAAAQNKATPDSSAVSASADTSAFPALPAPSSGHAASPAKPAPKTLRLVPTSKAEAQPPALSTFNLASRAVSAASRPETPVSHDMSDSASIMSGAVSTSRANSPPPSRIGSAPVRSTTKSQQRKARKEAHKEQSASIAQAQAAEPESHAPVLGRQKKKKKEKPVSSKAAERAAEKQAAAAAAATAKAEAEAAKAKEEEEVAAAAAKRAKEEEETKAKEKLEEENRRREAEEQKKKKRKLEKDGKAAQRTSGRDSQPADQITEDASKTMERVDSSRSHSDGAMSPSIEQPQQAAALDPRTLPEGVFQDLLKSKLTEDPESLTLLKPVGDQPNRSDLNNIPPPQPIKNIIDEADHRALLDGNCVHKVVDGQRVLLTPNGDALYNLTEEEEKIFLQYQDCVQSVMDQPSSFVAPRHLPQPRVGGFSLIKGRAVPNGAPSFFPPPPASQLMYSDDPLNKLQREEAIGYINQFVLPRLNLGNANFGFPGSWKSWATGAAGAGPAGAGAQKESMISSHSRDVAAASLNSLAPWIYGPDAAAGAGIYSAESCGGSLRDVLEDETPFGTFGDFGPENEPAGLDARSEAAFSDAAGDSRLEQQALQQRKEQPHEYHPHHPASRLPPLNGMSLMSVEDAETALQVARKETEKLEKGLNQVIRKNRRLLLPSRA